MLIHMFQTKKLGYPLQSCVFLTEIKSFKRIAHNYPHQLVQKHFFDLMATLKKNGYLCS